MVKLTSVLKRWPLFPRPGLLFRALSLTCADEKTKTIGYRFNGQTCTSLTVLKRVQHLWNDNSSHPLPPNASFLKWFDFNWTLGLVNFAAVCLNCSNNCTGCTFTLCDFLFLPADGGDLKTNNTVRKLSMTLSPQDFSFLFLLEFLQLFQQIVLLRFVQLRFFLRHEKWTKQLSR